MTDMIYLETTITKLKVVSGEPNFVTVPKKLTKFLFNLLNVPSGLKKIIVHCHSAKLKWGLWFCGRSDVKKYESEASGRKLFDINNYML